LLINELNHLAVEIIVVDLAVVVVVDSTNIVSVIVQASVDLMNFIRNALVDTMIDQVMVEQVMGLI
jgi:hypothetical protein